MSETTTPNNRGEGEVWKGLVAGLIGGLVASWTMNRFQDVWFKLSENGDRSAGGRSTRQSKEEQQTNSNEAEDDTTVKAASAISEGIFSHKLSEDEKKIAGPAVHYALGTGVGGLYGAVAEVMPEVTTGAGLPFGVAFWLVVDETAVPVLGLSKPPTEYPASTHVYALASHLVYGCTAELVRRNLRKAL
jgi:putative membrane protein